MNREFFKMYKKVINEIKQNDEINANILYREIWQDIILQYIVVGSTHNIFIFWLDKYTEKRNISENSKNLLIDKLVNDGFELGLKEEYTDAYAISKDDVITYINGNKKDNKIKSRKIITPFAETRQKRQIRK